MRTASWNAAHVASKAKTNAIQSQREPGRVSAMTSDPSAAAASGSAKFSMISCPPLVIQEPARISTAGMSATSGGTYRRATSHVGKATAQIIAALTAFAIHTRAVSESVTIQDGEIA